MFQNKYISAGFLFLDGRFFPTAGQGHLRLADKLVWQLCSADEMKKKNEQLKARGKNPMDSEEFIQERFEAIIIRFMSGKKYVYLPPTVTTIEHLEFLEELVKFYRNNNFIVVNLKNVSFEISSDERLKINAMKMYSKTIIWKGKKAYYNPNINGD